MFAFGLFRLIFGCRVCVFFSTARMSAAAENARQRRARLRPGRPDGDDDWPVSVTCPAPPYLFRSVLRRAGCPRFGVRKQILVGAGGRQQRVPRPARLLHPRWCAADHPEASSSDRGQEVLLGRGEGGHGKIAVPGRRPEIPAAGEFRRRR